MQNIDDNTVLQTFLESARNSYETEFIWHIKNFEMCSTKWGKPLKSPEFGIYNLKGPKFHLMLYAGGVNEKRSTHLSVYLVRSSHEEDDLICSGRLGIVTNKEKNICYEFHGIQLTQGQGKGKSDFFSRERLNSSEKDFIPDGILTIFCGVNVTNLTLSKKCLVSSQLTNLSEIYGAIYKNEKFCDLYLHVGEKTFKVHREILETRFPDLLKNIEGNKCKIEGISSKTMDILLSYVYTGFINVSELNLFEILSSKYALPSHLASLIFEKQKKIEVTTCFRKMTLYFSWNIQNFSSVDSSKLIHYSLIGDENIKWSWLDVLLSVSTDDSNEDQVTITIQRFSKECHRIACTIKATDISKTFHHTYEKDDTWTLLNFLLKDLVKANDEINLTFEIAVSNGTKTTDLEEKEFCFNSSLKNRTVEDLTSFRKDVSRIATAQKFCDVTLVTGHEKFRAHKFMLSARSPVFCETFETETVKKKNSEITINDLDSSVIKDLLTYIYCNVVKFSIPGIKHIHNIYTGATKYNLPGLKLACMDHIKSNLSADTVGDILISAYNWNDEDLKEMVYSYVCTHPLEISNSKEWEQLMLNRNDLAAEVLRKTLLHFAAKI